MVVFHSYANLPDGTVQQFDMAMIWKQSSSGKSFHAETAAWFLQRTATRKLNRACVFPSFPLHLYPLVIRYIAIEDDPFIVDLSVKDGDFPQLCYSRVSISTLRISQLPFLSLWQVEFPSQVQLAPLVHHLSFISISIWLFDGIWINGLVWGKI